MADIQIPYRPQLNTYRSAGKFPDPSGAGPAVPGTTVTARDVAPVSAGEAAEGAGTPRKPRHIWAWVYGILLTAYTVFTLLDVFVIPHDTMKVDQQAVADIYKTESSAVSSANSSAASSGNEAANGSTLGNTAEEPVITATARGYTYRDSNMTITLNQSYINNTMVYIADIQLNSIAALKSGLADDSFGRNLKEKTSEIADRVGAILAINGDYYGFRDTGYVIRNGILYRSTMSSQTAQDLVIYEDGTMEIITEGEITAEELLDKGALQVYSFGPGLVVNGEIAVTSSSEVSHSMNSNPRTALGYISPLHYVMVVSDGRTSESEGLSLLQLADIMQQLGCEQAYNLDGGGSTTMYFNGQVINNPTSGGSRSRERSVSDIVYIGY